MSATPPPGWYPDGQGNTRWWDGSEWAALDQGTAASMSVAPSSPPRGKRPIWPWAVIGVFGLVGIVMVATAVAGPGTKSKNTSASGGVVSSTAAVVVPAATSSAVSSSPAHTQAASTHVAKPAAKPAPATTAVITHAAPPVTYVAAPPPATHVAPPPPPFNYCGAPANPWHYNFCGGSAITNPASGVCTYFNCIPSFSDGVGYMVECNDGTFSMSGGRRGACSDHSGEGRTVYMP
jgi:hypothetical protein